MTSPAVAQPALALDPVCKAFKTERCTLLAGHGGQHIGSHGKPWADEVRAK